MVVYGCGGMEINDNGLLLILRRGVKTFNNLWSNPGGKVEHGETAEQATIRELNEELGIDVNVDYFIGTYRDYKRGSLFGIYYGFAVTIVGGEPRVMEPDKIAEVRRFPLDQLPDNLAPYTKQYYRDWIKWEGR